MILYPFQPGRAGGYSIVGFDEQTRQPRGELLLLPAGELPPEEFRGDAIFGGTSAADDPRQLRPAALAPPDARGVWADTQISGGVLEAYLRALLVVTWKDENGVVKPKTQGRMLDEKLNVAGLFTTVLLAQTDGKEHWFTTQSDGMSVCKSPMGMFDDVRIPNDLKLVDTTMRAYYGMED